MMNTLFVPLQYRIASTYVRVSLPFQHPSSSSPTSPTAVCCAVAVEFPMHCPSPHTHTSHYKHPPITPASNYESEHPAPIPPLLPPQRKRHYMSHPLAVVPPFHWQPLCTSEPISSMHCPILRQRTVGTTVDGAACGHCALTWHWVIYLAPSVCLHVHGEAQ